MTLGDTIADAGSGPVNTDAAEEARQLLAETINAMRERERLVLTLYYHEALTLADIGEVLDVTECRWRPRCRCSGFRPKRSATTSDTAPVGR